MTQDWRKIEAAIADFLEREGMTVTSVGHTGDRLAVVGTDEDGDPVETANITALARELADLK